jgi:hypothetical protein
VETLISEQKLAAYMKIMPLGLSDDEVAELSEDDSWLLRAEGLKDPKTPKEVLAKGAKDENFLVRHVAMLNPNTPLDVLREGIKDEHRIVRKSALEQLVKRISGVVQVSNNGKITTEFWQAGKETENE